MHARIIAVLGIAFLSSACGDSSSRAGDGGDSSSRPQGTVKPAFGDPALVRMEADNLKYEMALALEGIAIDRVLEPLSSSVHKAVGGCPDVLAKLRVGEIAAVRFRVAAGKVERAEDTTGTSDECLIRSLVQGGVPTKETFEAWVQLRKPPAPP